MIDCDLNVFVANLKTFKLKQVLSTQDFAQLGPLQPIDKIVRVSHFNSATSKLTLALVNPGHLVSVDL